MYLAADRAWGVRDLGFGQGDTSAPVTGATGALSSALRMSTLRTVQAARYVMPFRQGGSVPALVEGDDLGMYVMKLRGAAQGGKALVAELLGGELARRIGLAVPELVLVELDAAIASAEPDPELALPLEASVGTNLGLDYLPGSITFDPVAGPKPDATTASRIVMLDALILNVDRTVRNPNLLSWHERMWLIDHGAALYVHHGWTPETVLEGADDPFTDVASHVLLRDANELPAAAAHLTATLTPELIERICALVPEAWFDPREGFADVASFRAAYASFLVARLAALPRILEEAERARTV